MNAAMWVMVFFVFLAGALGGLINALMTDNGFLLPKVEKVENLTGIFRPGYLGNVLVGAVAAVVSWGLYGPLSPYYIVGSEQALAANALPEEIGLTLASLVGAILIGMGGARWLTSEVDKNLLRATAARAAAAKPSAAASQQIAMATPAQALDVARSMK
jgi:hypothetical protein